MSDVIVTRSLTKFYGTRPVVNALDLRVPQASAYGFLARNGAAPSTAIKMLTGLVHPDLGSAQLIGEDIARLHPDTRARIGYLAENHPLYRWMSVGEAVAFVRPFYP